MFSARFKRAGLGRKLAALEAVAQSKVLTRVAYAAALPVEAQTKVNIQADDLIDTGFLINSIHASALGMGDYDAAKAAAESRNPDIRMIPRYRHAKAGRAVVSAGAEYARYVHDGTSRIAGTEYMRRAFEQAKPRAAKAAAEELRAAIREVR